MDESQVQEIKSKSTSSVIFLFLRNLGIQGVSTIGFFLLTLLLGPSEIGLFAIVAESVSILGYFSDIGLASALIQQKEEIQAKDLQTTFLIQQTLVILLLLSIAIVYPQISLSRSYGSKELWILVSLCYAFFASSLKTIPSVLLERKLNFKLISTIDVIENLSFYLLAVLFAYLGFGAYSYAIATIVRSTLGLILIYLKSPWQLGLSFSVPVVKKLFKFGIPYQINTLIALAKDRISNLFVASIIGREAFGILSWAQKGPRIPLSFMDSLIKVSFPTFARLQNDPKLLRKSIEKITFYTSFFTFFLFAMISLLAPNLISLIPKYSKWTPAIVPLYLFSINAAIAAVTTPLTNLFNAVGKITTTSKFMIMWTVLTWIFYPYLSYRYGYTGTSIAALIVGSSSFLVWFTAQKVFSVNIFTTISKPLLSSLLIVILGVLIDFLDLANLPAIILKTTTLSVIYLLIHLLISPKELSWLIKQFNFPLLKKLPSF
jgi:O-antigen/teichoic acid export membrane protein